MNQTIKLKVYALECFDIKENLLNREFDIWLAFLSNGLKSKVSKKIITTYIQH